MKVSVHCFAYNARMQPSSIRFVYKDMEVSLSEGKSRDGKDKYDLTLDVTLPIDIETIRVRPEEHDPEGKWLEQRLRPYKEIMEEVSHLVEGILALKYLSAAPKFETEKIVVNVIPETPEDRKLFENNEVSQGFGNVYTDPRLPLFTEAHKITEYVSGAEGHIPALSFLAQATRSFAENNHEVAFFLFFRIVEGYFSDGSKDLERALLDKQEYLKKYIPYEDKLKSSLKTILEGLRLLSKSHINYSGLISDLVLIRHKLTHFSETNSTRHYQPSILFELDTVNRYMRITCMKILADRIKGVSEKN